MFLSSSPMKGRRVWVAVFLQVYKHAVASCLMCHLALLRLLCAHVQLWVPVFGQIVTALFMFQLFMVRRSHMPPTYYKQRPWLLSH